MNSLIWPKLKHLLYKWLKWNQTKRNWKVLRDVKFFLIRHYYLMILAVGLSIWQSFNLSPFNSLTDSVKLSVTLTPNLTDVLVQVGLFMWVHLSWSSSWSVTLAAKPISWNLYLYDHYRHTVNYYHNYFKHYDCRSNFPW